MESILQAKKDLEKKIIGFDFVSSIGTRHDEAGDYIEVGVTDLKNEAIINHLLTGGTWQGFRVTITEKPISSFQ